MDKAYIETQLKKFDITESTIQELKVKYSDLKIIDIKDIESYKAVHTARIEIKGYRVKIEHRRKELTEDALNYQRAINAEAKRITALLEPIEKHLLEQETFYDTEKERVKKDKEEAEVQLLKKRVDRLFLLEFSQKLYHLECFYMDKKIALAELKIMSDSVFEQEFHKISLEYEKNVQKKLEEERIEQLKKQEKELADKLEREKLIQQRREQEMEAERLRGIAHEQGKKEAELKKAQEEIRLAEDKKFKEETGFNIPRPVPFAIDVISSKPLSGHDIGFQEGYLSCLETIYELAKNVSKEELLEHLKEEIAERNK
jgi:hypothetical protein